MTLIKVDLSDDDGETLALELGVSEGFPLFQIRSGGAQLAQFGPCSLAEARGRAAELAGLGPEAVAALLATQAREEQRSFIRDAYGATVTKGVSLDEALGGATAGCCGPRPADYKVRWPSVSLRQSPRVSKLARSTPARVRGRQSA